MENLDKCEFFEDSVHRFSRSVVHDEIKPTQEQIEELGLIVDTEGYAIEADGSRTQVGYYWYHCTCGANYRE